MTARLWLIAALAAAVGGAAAADPVSISARRVVLDGNDPARTEVGRLRYRGGLDLTSPDPRFGGLSGLMIGPDGGRLAAVSDGGFWFTASVRYDGEGDLAGLSGAEIRPMRDSAGNHSDTKSDMDAEALAAVPGELAVAFEIDHRIWFYRSARGPAVSALVPPPARSAPPALTGNFGLEAITALAGGRVLALGEGRPDTGELRPGWIVDRGNNWRRLSYRARDRYRPSGAATLASGDLLVLERRFSWVEGMAARVVRVPADQVRPGAVLEGVRLATLAPPLISDNFEGIDARRTESGRTLIYLISDDNYNIVQRTLLLMFELDDDGGPRNGRD